MQNTFTGAHTVGEIVTKFPSAANIFKEERIDFCCGGNRTLSEALEQKKIDEPIFLEKLNEKYEAALKRGADQGGTDWDEVTWSDLIEHIVDKHHAYLRAELPLLSEFVTKILRVHGAGHPELAQLHRVFHHMKTELELHLVNEEEVLFPLIKQAESEPTLETLQNVVPKIDESEGEHDVVGDALKEMRELTSDYTLPDGACRTYTLTFQKLEELESDIFEHVHLENNILFLRVEKKLKEMAAAHE